MVTENRSAPFASQWQQQKQPRASQPNNLQQPRTAIDMASAADQQKAGRAGAFNQGVKEASGRMALANTQLQSQRMGLQGNSQRHIGNITRQARPEMFTRRQINSMNKAMLDVGRGKARDWQQPGARERAIHAGNKRIRSADRGLYNPRRPVFAKDTRDVRVPRGPVFGGQRQPYYQPTIGLEGRTIQQQPRQPIMQQPRQPTIGLEGRSIRDTLSPPGGSGWLELNKPTPVRQPVFNTMPYEPYQPKIERQPYEPMDTRQEQHNQLMRARMSGGGY
jgi:hypothetical protein